MSYFTYIILANRSGVAREKKSLGKFSLNLAYVTPRQPWVPLKMSALWSSRLAGHRKHIYECLVLLYRR